MALELKDRVKVTTTTTGTGALAIGSAQFGYRSFSVLSNGATTYYTVVDNATGDWEVGLGTYSASGPTLDRTTVLSSSTGTTINLQAGPKDLFISYPAGRAVTTDGLLFSSILSTPTTLSGYGISDGVRFFNTGTPLPSSDIGPIWHDDYASIMTWRVINTYTGYASINIGQITFLDSSATTKGWLKAAGQTISETYAALIAYRGSFTLPDLRGEFIRGWDDGRGVDSGRALHSTQADALQSHSHYQRMGGGIDPSTRVGTATTDVYAFSTLNQQYGKNDISTLTTGGTGTFTTETRPRNVAFLACIKY